MGQLYSVSDYSQPHVVGREANLRRRQGLRMFDAGRGAGQPNSICNLFPVIHNGEMFFSMRHRRASLVKYLLIGMMGFAGMWCPNVYAQTGEPLIVEGEIWSYWDQGHLDGDEWYKDRDFGVDWPKGAAPLGYGEPAPATTVSRGQPQRTTTYFRKTFDVGKLDTAPYQLLEIQRDDGAVVYLNGRLVGPTNLSYHSQFDADTFAITNVKDGREGSFLPMFVDSSLLVEGENFIAVEVHQHSPSSSDLAFDLRMSPWTAVDVFEEVPLTSFEGEIGEVAAVGALDMFLSTSGRPGRVVHYFRSSPSEPWKSGGPVRTRIEGWEYPEAHQLTLHGDELGLLTEDGYFFQFKKSEQNTWDLETSFNTGIGRGTMAYNHDNLVVAYRNTRIEFFRRENNEWSEEAFFEVPDTYFSNNLALFGDTVAIGLFDIQAGNSYWPREVQMYSRDESGWKLFQAIEPPEELTYSHFGTSLALEDGTLIVGSPGSSSVPSGEVLIYERSLFGGWPLTARFYGDDRAPTLFGLNVGLEGAQAVVFEEPIYIGQDRETLARVHVLRKIGRVWRRTSLVALDGDFTFGEDPRMLAFSNGTVYAADEYGHKLFASSIVTPLRIEHGDVPKAYTGQLFQFEFSGTPAVDVAGFATLNLPNWARLETLGDSGARLSGTPDVNDVGQRDVELRVNRQDGSFTRKTVTIEVIESGLPPRIVEHPRSQTTLPGRSVRFDVSVLQEGSDIQWFFQDDAISGADTIFLEIDNLRLEDAGAYHAQISNAAGTVRSEQAILRVLDLDPSTTFVVPGDYENLRDALLNSVSGSTIVVGPGTYRGLSSWLDTTLQLISLEGPANTTLEGLGADSLEIIGGSRIEGFTLTDFDELVASDSTIKGNWFRGDTQPERPKLIVRGGRVDGNCFIGSINREDNNGNGELVVVESGAVEFVNNVVTESAGVGLHLIGGTVDVAHNVFHNNRAGIALKNTLLLQSSVYNNIFSENLWAIDAHEGPIPSYQTNGLQNVHHNLFFDSSVRAMPFPNTQYDNLEASPRFRNPVEYDFVLLGDSAARDAGIESEVSPFDVGGRGREGAHPDLGPRQYVDSTVDPPIRSSHSRIEIRVLADFCFEEKTIQLNGTDETWQVISTPEGVVVEPQQGLLPGKIHMRAASWEEVANSPERGDLVLESSGGARLAVHVNLLGESRFQSVDSVYSHSGTRFVVNGSLISREGSVKLDRLPVRGKKVFWSPDDTKLYMIEQNNVVTVVDSESLRPIGGGILESDIRWLGFPEDGSLLVADGDNLYRKPLVGGGTDYVRLDIHEDSVVAAATNEIFAPGLSRYTIDSDTMGTSRISQSFESSFDPKVSQSGERVAVFRDLFDRDLKHVASLDSRIVGFSVNPEYVFTENAIHDLEGKKVAVLPYEVNSIDSFSDVHRTIALNAYTWGKFFALRDLLRNKPSERGFGIDTIIRPPSGGVTLGFRADNDGEYVADYSIDGKTWRAADKVEFFNKGRHFIHGNKPGGGKHLLFRVRRVE